jgi:hypothetical protein
MFGWLHQFNRIARGMINSNPARTAAGWQTWWGTSGLVHAAGLGILALVAIRTPLATERAEFQAEFAAEIPESAIRIDLPVQATVSMASSAGGRAGVPGPIAAGVETAGQSAARQIVASLSNANATAPLELEPRLPPKGDLVASALGKKVGKGFALGGGLGLGVGEGQGNGSGSQFFELATAGTKFVYVLDGSGSMTEPHSEARTRLDRVKQELRTSIGGMPEEMEFFVIFFNRIAVPMPAEKLQPATLGNKRKYLEWCWKVKGGGGTDPGDALKKALELNPDVIYLLTDGVFKDDAVRDVTKLNTRGVSIHTFCFGDATGERVLKEIARKNGGTYKFIP